jgi:hypothetical protein
LDRLSAPIGSLARVVAAGEPLPMKLVAALAKLPLEAIRDSEITQPAHAGTRGHLAAQRYRRLLAGVLVEGVTRTAKAKTPCRGQTAGNRSSSPPSRGIKWAIIPLRHMIG